MSVPALAELRFGLADAEQEGVTEPDLLLAGYLDVHRTVEQVLKGDRYVVLGYKGAGKSAVSQHLKLRAERDPGLFVRVAYLSDFPYDEFLTLVPGRSDSDTRMPTGWCWLLLAYLMDSFRADEGADRSDGELSAVLGRLESAGLLPTGTLPTFVRESVQRSLKVTLPKLFEYSRQKLDGPADTAVPLLVEKLIDVAVRFRSHSEHVLVIDGLDDVLIGSARQLKTLAALLLAASRLNRAFQVGGTPAKVVLLFRTDLFEKLPGANKNKIRQDAAVNLDWYHHTREPAASNLVKLANLKARVLHPSAPDVFETYFPSRVSGRPIHKYLLDYTRHTPRDFLQLLRRMQEFSDGPRKLTVAQIKSGVRWYSNDYFLPEIKDELVGFMDAEDVDLALRLLTTMKFKHFHLEDAIAEAARSSVDLDVRKTFRVLFDCSAIGTVERSESSTAYFTFRYRNRHSHFVEDETIRVHKGLWIALQLTKDASSLATAAGVAGLDAQ